ncbi:hypothetical protein AMTRI_Chr07g79870 [Amborella trichopoda]
MPKELMLKVFEALPLKALCRFTTVCKSWNQLLSSPSFVPSSLSSPKTFFLFETSSLSSAPKTKRNRREDRLYYADDIDYTRASFCKETTFQHASIGISSCSNGILYIFSIPTPNTQVDMYNIAFSFDPIIRNIIIMAVEWDFIGPISENKKQCLWIYDSMIQNWRSLDVGLPIYDPSSSHPFCTSHCIVGTTWYALRLHSVVCYDMKKKAWEKIDSPLSLEHQLEGIDSNHTWWYSEILEWNGRLSFVITRRNNIDGSLKAGVWVFSWEEKKWVEALRADLKEWGLTGQYRHIGFYDDIFFLVAYNKCITYEMKCGHLKRFESDYEAGWFLPKPFRPNLFTWKPKSKPKPKPMQG